MAPRHRTEKGGDARVSRLEPWIFRDEAVNVDELRALGQPALLVNVVSSEGRELGSAACNLQKGGPTGVNILARMLTENVSVPIDCNFFMQRIRRALQHRVHVFGTDKPYYRLLNAEGDLFPGTICDRYGDVLCLQFTAAAMEHLFQADLLDALEAVLAPRAIIVRYDAHTDRQLELAPLRPPMLARGEYTGPTVLPAEDGFVFEADLLSDGWSPSRFFEDRQQRELLAAELASIAAGSAASAPSGRGASRQAGGASPSSVPRGPQQRGPAGGAAGSTASTSKPPPQAEVLSFFGEGLAAFCAARGARVTCVEGPCTPPGPPVPPKQRGSSGVAARGESDGGSGSASGASSSSAAARLAALAARNGCTDHVEHLRLEQPQVQQLGEHRVGAFDIVIVAPPPLAPTYGRLEDGAQQYTAWVALAAAAVKPGGLLLFACRSRTMTPVRLLRCANLGIWSVKRRARLVHRSASAGLDFPVHLALPDSNQLQVMGLRVL